MERIDNKNMRFDGLSQLCRHSSYPLPQPFKQTRMNNVLEEV